MMPKTICIISPNLGKGGMERFLSIISRKLADKYFIIIITLIDDTVEYPFDDRIKIIHINKEWNKKKLSMIWTLFKLLRRIKPTVVVGFSEVFNPITIIVSRLNRLKVYVSDRSNPLKKHTIRDRITRTLLYPYAKGMIAQTELARQIALSKKFNNNICVIANPLMNFVNSDINPSKKFVVTTGRLEKTKNHLALLEIFSRITNSEWKLLIVGDGKEKENIENKIKELKLEDRVVMAGKQDDIEYWLNKGSVFMFTSLSEGFPNALSEALAAPLATIAYDCPAGVSDLIHDDENGILIPLNNQELYIEKLNRLIDSEELRRKLMTESIKNREEYKVELIADRLIRFLNV